MTHRRISYVNGRYCPHDHASVHIEDRGYQFSDGVYEVIELLAGKLVDEDGHFQRLLRSLSEVDIPVPTSLNALKIIIYELARQNGKNDGYVYIQVTRGVSPRNHAFPNESVQPSLVVMFLPAKAPSEKEYEKGVSVATFPDIRWGRCDIKSISLLPNVLAKQEAIKRGVKEVWFVNDNGDITEGSSTNAYIVEGKTIFTHPVNEHILGGITRDTVINLACDNGFTVVEEAFARERVYDADEAFLTSTTSGVLSVVSIDDKPIGKGKPGKVAKKLLTLYREH